MPKRMLNETAVAYIQHLLERHVDTHRGAKPVRCSVQEVADALGLVRAGGRVKELKRQLTEAGYWNGNGFYFPLPRKKQKDKAAHPNYKGRNAKLGVLAARITDDELREVEAAALKLSKRARERGGVPYVRSDLVRGAVLDFARWVNDIKSPAKLDEAIEVLEDALT